MSEDIRKVLNEHPDLPVMLLTPNCGDGEYESYYHEGVSAEVQYILMPHRVNKVMGSYCGLNDEVYYTDKSEAAEDVAEWLFESWDDAAREHGFSMSHSDIPDDALTEFCGFEYAYKEGQSLALMADSIAERIVDEMPWQKYVVIRAVL